MTSQINTASERLKSYSYFYANNDRFRSYVDNSKTNSLCVRVIGTTISILETNGWDKSSDFTTAQRGGPTSLNDAVYLAAIRSIGSKKNVDFDFIIDTCYELILQGAYKFSKYDKRCVDRTKGITFFEDSKRSDYYIFGGLKTAYSTLVQLLNDLPEDIQIIYSKINFNPINDKQVLV